MLSIALILIQCLLKTHIQSLHDGRVHIVRWSKFFNQLTANTNTGRQNEISEGTRIILCDHTFMMNDSMIHLEALHLIEDG